jgi:ADP-heptose:LPS heptosyltransferase
MYVRQATEPTKIAVFRALYLGDFICATPALSALRARYPRAKLTYIGLPWTAEISNRFDFIDTFESFPGFPGLPETPFDPPRTFRFLERMRAEKFDLAIQLHGSGQVSNWFAGALGARETIGYRRDEEADPRLDRSLPWREDESEIRRWLRLVALVGAGASDRVRFPFTDAESEQAADLLGEAPCGGPRIGLHPGAKLPSRRWPIDRFVRLGKLLARSTNATFVLTGTESERSLTSWLRSQLATPVLDLTGRTDLGTLAAVIGRLDLLVTNDTGASHMAAATSTPSVVLFGPSEPRRWAPLDSNRHHVIDGGTNGTRGEASVATIPVERVLSACLRQLALPSQPQGRIPDPISLPSGTWGR